MRIVVDEPKLIANLAKHQIDQNDVEAGFDFRSAAYFPARTSRTGRERIMPVGRMFGHGTVVVVFSPLGSEAIGLVSVRPASVKERRLHERR